MKIRLGYPAHSRQAGLELEDCRADAFDNLGVEIDGDEGADHESKNVSLEGLCAAS